MPDASAPMSLPSPLVPGARVLVVAPSSAPKSDDAYRAGLAALRDRDLDVRTIRETLAPHGYLAGPDDERLAEFNTALRDPDADAIFCARGGVGALRLLDGLDYAAARRRPKLLVGYSDITALHLALYARAGWRGLSGPMVAVEWAEGTENAHDAASEALFWHLARGGVVDDLTGPQGERLVGVVPGEAEGVLVGGNLSLVARLVGTPYLPDLRGAILFLEEVGEEPYRLDGLLAQLHLAGVLDGLGGLVLGTLTAVTPTQTHFLTQEAVLAHYTERLACPVATGLAYGHHPSKNTMPVGVRARLTATEAGGAARLSVLEPVTRPVAPPPTSTPAA